MLRVTLLVGSPSKRAHGNAASRLALGLAETGQVETTLLCYSRDAPPRWLPSDVRIRRLSADRASRSLAGLVRYLRAESPDVLITRQVHANFIGLAAAGLARLPRSWPGRLIIVCDSNVELAHARNWRDNKWLAKASYRFADGIVAPSPTVRDNVISWCGLKPSSAAVVPNPIPRFSGPWPAAPHPWLQSGAAPVFIHISNMLPLKRLDLLIDAFADVRQSHDVRLLILGDGRARLDGERQIRRLGLTESVQMVGWIDDPLPYAARAWALVHPSDEEGFAQVLSEAMSVGCPVIATDALGGGPRYVTDNGRYGVLVPRGSRQLLAEAMVAMLQTETRARYSELGSQRAEALSPAASAAALLGFLSALGSRRCSGPGLRSPAAEADAAGSG
jgi:glycosyltransferase involved in cell wall biosynthesis